MSSHTRKPVHAYLKIYDGGSKVITNFSATNSLTQDARETSQLDPANTLAVMLTTPAGGSPWVFQTWLEFPDCSTSKTRS